MSTEPKQMPVSPNIAVIQRALEQATQDVGALFELDVLLALKEVRAETPAEYQRLRERAKAHVSVSELDKLTFARPTSAGNGDGAVQFPEVKLWHEPVDGETLLTEVAASIKRYVVAEDATIRAAALWAVHTWLMDVWTVSPIANITSPEMRCGKTVLLNTLGRLVNRPLPTSNIATAALFRSMALWSPSLLIDEVDSFLKDNEGARGIIDAGLYREFAFVMRCAGEDHTPTKFSVWGAKALCGIGKLQATLADRSIHLRLRRKLPQERVENLRRSEPAQWSKLRSRIARWVDDHQHVIASVATDRIPDLNDRENDCWEPLLAIAHTAGETWYRLARESALALRVEEEEPTTANIELLRDVRAILEREKWEVFFSSNLLEKLEDLADSPWAGWNRGSPLTYRQLKSRLGEFGIWSKAVRVGKSAGKSGYRRKWFDDAFSRYLGDEDQTSKHLDAADEEPSAPLAQAPEQRLDVGPPDEDPSEELARYARLLED